MHEFSLVQALFEQIDVVARENRLDRVTAVEIEVGELRAVIPEVMETAFAYASQDSLADGAKLTCTEKKALARCRGCQQTFRPHMRDFRCPSCYDANATILEGNDFVLLCVKGVQKGKTDS